MPAVGGFALGVANWRPGLSVSGRAISRWRSHQSGSIFKRRVNAAWQTPSLSIQIILRPHRRVVGAIGFVILWLMRGGKTVAARSRYVNVVNRRTGKGGEG